MATISVVTSHLDRAEDVFLIELRRGEAFPWPFNFTDHADDAPEDDEGTPHDTSGWTIECKAEFYTGAYTTGGNPSNLVVDESTPVRNMSITAVDASAGTWMLEIPRDIYPHRVDPNLTRNVPMAILFITINQGGMPPVIDVEIGYLVFRRGPPA